MGKSLLNLSCLGALSLFVSIQTPAAVTTLTGVNGKVNIGETLLSSTRLGYLVDTIGSTSVEAFAVSNNTVNWANVAGDMRVRWGYAIVNAAQWDSGVSMAGRDGNIAFTTSSLGTYSSFFGTDRFATIYVVNHPTAVTLDDSNDQDSADWNTATPEFGIRKITSSASEFVALDANWNIIDRSLSASFPEPAMMSVLAMTVPLFARRRRV